MPASLEPVSTGITILAIVFLAQVLKELGIPSLGLTHSILLYAGCQFASGSPYLGAAIIFFTFLGSLCGSSLIFWLARRNAEKLLALMFRYRLVSPKTLARAQSLKKGSSFLAVSLGRSIPGLMAATSFLAGAAGFSISSFYSIIVLTLSLWMVVIVSLGSTLGYYIPQVTIPSHILLAFLVPVIAVGLLVGLLALRRRKLNPDK